VETSCRDVRGRRLIGYLKNHRNTPIYEGDIPAFSIRTEARRQLLLTDRKTKHDCEPYMRLGLIALGKGLDIFQSTRSHELTVDEDRAVGRFRSSGNNRRKEQGGKNKKHPISSRDPRGCASDGETMRGDFSEAPGKVTRSQRRQRDWERHLEMRRLKPDECWYLDEQRCKYCGGDDYVVDKISSRTMILCSCCHSGYVNALPVPLSPPVPPSNNYTDLPWTLRYMIRADALTKGVKSGFSGSRIFWVPMEG